MGRGTASKAGRSLLVAIATGLCILCAGALVIQVALPIEFDAGPLALGSAGAALLGVVFAHRAIARTRAHQDKVSEELDALSQTLLRIEGGRRSAAQRVEPCGRRGQPTVLIKSSVAHHLEILGAVARRRVRPRPRSGAP